jgi:muconolactone delta-isomerase
MQMAMSANRPQFEESIALIEQIMLPSLQLCHQMCSENRIVAGGVISGAIAVLMIIEVESSQEVDRVLMDLPFWSVMKTTVMPLIEFSDRFTHLSHRVDQLKSMVSSAS